MFSIIPKDLSEENEHYFFDYGENTIDFDFDLKLSKEYFGVESDKLMVIGHVKLKSTGEYINYTAPVPFAKWHYELVPRYSEKYEFEVLNF